MADEPAGLIGTVSLRAGVMDCWACGCETTIVTGIDVSFGPKQWQLTVAAFDDFPDLFDPIRDRIPAALEVGAIKPRFSKTLGRSYLSNGCVHCDALIGQFYEHHAWEGQETKHAFPAQLTDRWAQALAAAYGEEPDEAIR